MPEPHEVSITPRRGFIARLAIGAAALLVGRPAQLRANSGTRVGGPDDWVDRIHGKYRQLFDATTINDGMGAAYALNFLDSTKSAHDLSDADVCAVLSLRHQAVALGLTDAAWAKYALGEQLTVSDPSTKLPATRNVYRTNIRGRGITYDEMIASRGVIVTVCDMALGGLGERIANKQSLDVAATQRQLRASLIPGVVIVPSGVYAVNRAQQAGCTYCYAG